MTALARKSGAALVTSDIITPPNVDSFSGDLIVILCCVLTIRPFFIKSRIIIKKLQNLLDKMNREFVVSGKRIDSST